jgi:hypothetical protein
MFPIQLFPRTCSSCPVYFNQFGDQWSHLILLTLTMIFEFLRRKSHVPDHHEAAVLVAVLVLSALFVIVYQPSYINAAAGADVELMLPTLSLRALRARAPRVQGIRFSSHDAPQYNESSGWLFGEKVHISFMFSSTI